MPTGNNNNPRDVPCAWCWLNPRKKTNAGTTIMPPPTPTIPLNIPAKRPIMIKSIIVSLPIGCDLSLIRYMLESFLIKIYTIFHDFQSLYLVSEFFYHNGFIFQFFIFLKEMTHFIKEMFL